MSSIGGGGSPIKSIQRGTISTTASITVTITAVDTDKSVVNLLGYSNADNSAFNKQDTPRVVLTNATTLTFTRGIINPQCVTSWEVIEYA